jgi:hypothetical protein
MNRWKIIWDGYFSFSTVKEIFKNIISKTSFTNKIYMILLIILFIIGFVIYLQYIDLSFVTKKYTEFLGLFLSIVSEILLIINLNGINKSLIENEYGIENSMAPPSSENHQSTRYLLFKKHLFSNNITKDDVEKCEDLIDIQIDIASTENTGLKKASNFMLGIILGILTALWKHTNINQLLLIAFILVLFYLIIEMINSAFPSKVLKLKELKYFMQLFIREKQYEKIEQ